jgi:uncharacterized membrane protein (DUF4010 family)
MQIDQFLPFFIAVLLGALLGFERAFASREEEKERHGHDLVGGVRTYALISLLGCLASFLNAAYQHGILLAAFIGTMLLTVVAYYISYSRKDEPGITTEISILISFIIGVTVQHGHYILGAFITMLVMLILHLKKYLDTLTGRIESEDISALVKFGIVTLVILPLLDPGYALRVGDLGIEWLNRRESLAAIRIVAPHTVWLMVVLISGISFTGYIAMKVLGTRRGIGLTGLLGGFVSSTATAISFARQSSREERLSMPLALAVLLASSIMFPRILVEVLIVNSSLLPGISATMGLMAAAGFVFCALSWKRSEGHAAEGADLRNPFDIMPAVKFGLLYALVVLVARLAGEFAGAWGVYAVSLLSGLTDVDSIVLAMCQLAKEDPSRTGQAAVAITLAAFSNTALKAGVAFSLGSAGLRRTALAGFAVIIAAGIAGLFLMRMAG